MKVFRTLALAGAAALASGAVATAAEQTIHVMTVRLPGGAVEQIRYTGDTPRIQVVTGPVAPTAFAPLAGGLFSDDAAFARLSQISALMERQSALMWRALADARATGDGLTMARLEHLPAGARGFSTVSTMTASGVCTRSIEYIAGGAGRAPKMISRSSGACGVGPTRGAPTAQTGTAVPTAYAPASARPDQQPHWH